MSEQAGPDRSGAGFRRFKEEVVRARTGRSTEEWNTILDSWAGRVPTSPGRDNAGSWAKAKGHTLAARFLLQEHGLSPWWAQAVTIRYEYERGLRG